MNRIKQTLNWKHESIDLLQCESEFTLWFKMIKRVSFSMMVCCCRNDDKP